MKKVFALLLVLVMAASLFACAPKAEPEPDPAPVVTPETDPTPTPTEKPTEEPPQDPPADTTEGVKRIIVLNNVIEGLTASEQPRRDAKFNSYSMKEILEKLEITDETCKVVGSDGYEGPEDVADLLEKYVTLEGEEAPVLVGEAQDPDWAVFNFAYITFSQDVIMTSYKDQISVKEVFEAVGMAEAASYDFVCTDGYTHNIAAEDIGECFVSWIGEGDAISVDGVVPGIGDYTLMKLLYIVPAA